MASEVVELTVVLFLPLVVFGAGALDASILLPCLPLHHAEAQVKEEDEIQAPRRRLRRSGGMTLYEPRGKVKEGGRQGGSAPPPATPQR
jgi:hypothetical protein